MTSTSARLRRVLTGLTALALSVGICATAGSAVAAPSSGHVITASHVWSD